jgi:hypothetical protein
VGPVCSPSPDKSPPPSGLPRAAFVGGAAVVQVTKRRRAVYAVVFMPPTGIKNLDDWVAAKRTVAIDRIAKAVGKVPESEEELATDIYWACSKTSTGRDPLEGARAKTRFDKVQEIIKAAEKLDTLIASDPFISARLRDRTNPFGAATPFELPPLARLRFGALYLRDELGLAAKHWRDKADLSDKRRPSEREWLAGVSLPLVYERHFGHRPGRSRNAKGEPSGPTVRFVEATLREVGAPCKRETIVRAFSRLAKQRDDERTKKGWTMR